MTPSRRSRHGFTLVELLTVIGIIILLLAILLPVVSQVRVRANVANTQQQMSRIMSACVNYYHEFNAYPGPIADANLNKTGIKGAQQITSSENLVLGLLYYLQPPAPGQQVTFVPDNPTGANTQPKSSHDPVGLNPLHPGVTYHFIDYLPDELTPSPPGTASSLLYAGGQTGTPPDSVVPEFLDKIPDPMPILYLRAHPGAANGPKNVVATADNSTQYNYSQLGSYGCAVRGSGATKSTWMPFDLKELQQLNKLKSNGQLASDVTDPFLDFNDYFQNPNIANVPRGKDGFILISAGADRTYGTKDDIIVSP